MVAVKKQFEVQITRRDASDRNDAGPSAYLSQELEHVLSDTYRTEIAPHRIMELIPVRTDVDSRAPTISYSLLTQAGAAAIGRSPNYEIPRVDIFRQKFTSPVKELFTMYGFGLVELENADYAKVPLEAESGIAAREVIAELESSIAINGHPATSLPGLMTNPNIPRSTVAAGVGGTTWGLKTSDEILRDLSAVANTMASTTKGRHAPDTLLLPIDQFNAVAEKPRASGSDETTLSYFKRTNQYIKRVEWLRELDGIGTGGSDVALAFKSDPRVFAYFMVLPFEQRPQQERNLEIQVICRAKSGGTIVFQPLGLHILEGI